MSKALSRDMTKGSEASHIIHFAVPMLIGNLLQQLYNIVDTAIVGKFLGDKALAAVGATGSVTFFFYTLCLGLATGAGIIVAQHYGANNSEKVKSAIFNSAFVTLIFGVFISVVSVFAATPVLKFLNTPKHLLSTSSGYMKIACGGTIAVAAYNWITAIMRSLGDTKTPLIFLGVASILNVGLDLLFVVVFDFGVKGAAAATIVSQCVSAIGSIIYAFLKNPDIKLNHNHMHLQSQMIKSCIWVGTPIALQNAMVSMSMIALQRVTNTFGETVMAAYTATMRIEQLIQQPFQSIGAASSTFTGQNVGAQKPKRVISGYHVALKITAMFAFGMALIFSIFSVPLVKCFVSGTKTVYIASRALRINCCFYMFLGLIHTTRGFLNGAGDTTYAAINGLVEVICRIVFSILLTSIAVIGHWGIWLTTCITWFSTGIISVIRYKQGIWKTKSIVNK